MSERELRRIVLKEEFVALTGDYIKAIILAQLEYWQKRAREFDKFIIEEKERSMREGMEVTMNLTHGWIYKSAQELSEETMLGLSKSNIRAHLKALIDAGYVRERPNPYYKWDKTMQYRLDLVKIKQDLNRLGYELQDWVLDVSAQNHTSSVLEHRSTQREPSERQAEGEEDGGDEDSNVSAQNHTSSILERRSTQSRTSMFQNRTSRFYFRTSMFQNRTAIPDTITEITNNISTPPIVPPSKGGTWCGEKNFSDRRNHTRDREAQAVAEDLRAAIYRKRLTEVYDNLSDVKTFPEVVEEAAERASKDIVVNRVRFLTENGVKIVPREVARRVRALFPYEELPDGKRARKDFFVEAVCTLTVGEVLSEFP